MGEDIHIGNPISNMHLRIVDETLRELPPGVTGELCIGGVGLGVGYMNRPDLTQQQFVFDPVTGERIYRSGDLARWVKSGDTWHLECLGRIDAQIKLRGFRIELGEIDAAMLDLPHVATAAAVLRAPNTPGAEIIGYVSAKEGAELDGAHLRDQLSERLPMYMVPSHVVVLKELPQTPNGKINRKALVAREVASKADLTEDKKAATQTELELHEMWSESVAEHAAGWPR